MNKWSKRIFIFGMVLYAFSFRNRFVWDDYLYIVNNIYVGDWSYLKELLTTGVTHGYGSVDNYYRPLSSLTLSIDKSVWGNSTFGFHLTQTWMHALAGTILFLLLKELKFGRWPSLWVSLIFLSHPVQVQAVAYMASRGDPQYALLLFTGLYLWQKSWSKKPKLGKFSVGSKGLIALSLLCYVGSFLSKEIGIAGVGLYFIVWWIKTDWPSLSKVRGILAKDKSHSMALIGIALIAAIYLYLRFTIFNFTNWEVGGVLPEVYKQNFLVRIFTFGGVFWQYLIMILKPFPMYFERSSPILTNLNLWFLGFSGFVFLIFWFGYQEYKKRKTGWIWVGLAWFLGMILPVSGIITVNGLLFDNWMYLPLVGFTIMILSLIRYYFPNTLKLKKVLFLLIALLSLLTFNQIRVWENEITFFEHNIKHNPTARIHRNLATSYAKESRYREALEHYEQSLAKDVENPEEVLLSKALVHDNLGETSLAFQTLTTALETNEDYHKARHYYIKRLIEDGLLEEAFSQAQILITKKPDDWSSYIRLGQIKHAQGDNQAAEEYFEKAIEVSDSEPRILEIIEAIRQNQRSF